MNDFNFLATRWNYTGKKIHFYVSYNSNWVLCGWDMKRETSDFLITIENENLKIEKCGNSLNFFNLKNTLHILNI